ncbi:hypothetical protein RvY_17054 [Ramazzottius varieornatus]|uniref:Homeobox domain-containing protein n=1 Tax=Ramazzottius varieornatus TaxID=947166 RepID=A0A1D1W1A4_RAMVA|nr:hypothetical protein RvY_17054 [Ramazzottius varieornatus]
MSSGFSQFSSFPYSSVLGPSPMMGSNCLQPGVHAASCDPVHARNIIVDPQSGQSICSCQYERFMAAYRQYMFAGPLSGIDPAVFGNGNPPSSGSSASLHGDRDGGLHSSLSTSSTHPALIRDPSNLYGDVKTEMPMESSVASWRAAMGMTLGMGGLPSAHGGNMAGCYAPYDPSMAGAPLPYPPNPYCSNNYGMDPNGMNRRKNATRETTSQLKHWLYEHRKNPYPTKAEKIMLAILTKMTLTQVSTWFANARRRLKKENKMTWSPRNRGCEDDDKSESDGLNAGDDQDIDLDKDDFSDAGSLKASPAPPPAASDLVPDGNVGGRVLTGNGADKDVENSTKTAAHATSQKPRIWSLADVAMDKPSGNPTIAPSPAMPSPEAMLAFKSHMITSSASFPRPMSMEQQLPRAPFHPSFNGPFGSLGQMHGQLPVAPNSSSNPVFVPNPNSAFSAPLHNLSSAHAVSSSTTGKMKTPHSHRVSTAPYESPSQVKLQGSRPLSTDMPKSSPLSRLNSPTNSKDSRTSPESNKAPDSNSTQSTTTGSHSDDSGRKLSNAGSRATAPSTSEQISTPDDL